MTEEQIIAYVDGELGPIEALRFKRAIEADPVMAAAVERHRRLRALVHGHFAPVADEPMPERLTALLDSNVAPFPAKRGGWPGQGGRYAALAASLVAGLVAGQLLPFGPSAPIAEKDGAIVAQGDLAEALDSQLASAQGGAYRIGVSFRGSDSRYCRTFSGDAGAGIGCHGDEGWRLERFAAGAPGESGSDYRQAGSASAEILAAAQEMMAGDPLDAAAEAEARARGWR